MPDAADIGLSANCISWQAQKHSKNENFYTP